MVFLNFYLSIKNYEVYIIVSNLTLIAQLINYMIRMINYLYGSLNNILKSDLTTT